MALGVVDASVVAKWFLEEEHTSEARRLRDDFLAGTAVLRAPALLPFEIMNALRFHPTFPSESLTDAARALDRTDIVTVPLVGEYLERTTRLALAEELTVYDASYVALAGMQDCPLYTADERIIRLRENGFDIVHIADYGGTV
jgi:predicted nucleic acid-binding protein